MEAVKSASLLLEKPRTASGVNTIFMLNALYRTVDNYTAAITGSAQSI